LKIASLCGLYLHVFISHAGAVAAENKFSVLSSVADPDHFDPDPAVYFDTDPDPCHF
jgi:hypothetical protein